MAKKTKTSMMGKKNSKVKGQMYDETADFDIIDLN